MKKHFNKYLSLVAIVSLFIYSCESGDEDPRFLSNPETGWVEFQSAATTTGQTVDMVSIALNIDVPIYKDGISIRYSFTAVEGDFTRFVTGTGGTLFASPDNTSRVETIDIPLRDMEIGRDFITVFDVTLESTSIGGVGIGDGVSSVTTHRISIPCSNPDVLPSTYLVGDYLIADQAAEIGPGNGTTNFANIVVTVTVDPNDPNGRLFSIPLLPAFRPGPVDMKIRFDEDDFVTLDGQFSSTPGLSCDGATLYEFIGQTADAAGPWDICNDQTLTIEYIEDPLGSCGGPYNSSFTMTKQ